MSVLVILGSEASYLSIQKTLGAGATIHKPLHHALFAKRAIAARNNLLKRQIADSRRLCCRLLHSHGKVQDMFMP
jgi:hypothetical protein